MYADKVHDWEEGFGALYIESQEQFRKLGSRWLEFGNLAWL